MDLPGADLIRRGIEDLEQGRVTSEALLVSIGAPRLRGAGLDLPPTLPDSDHRLYRLLAERHGNDAHSQYNALIRRLVSFERALECAR
jgi:hypothetical protein